MVERLYQATYDTGFELAVEHLVDLGHRRIAHAHGQRAPGAAERRRGYREAMRNANLETEVLLVPGGVADEDGEPAARQLLAPSPPTAVTAFNDHCAAGLFATAGDAESTCRRIFPSSAMTTVASRASPRSR
jgi:DNA-binding LacI/PurR family transcriptional regulator